jgi:Fur family ferric uptake transcriptional regulator
MTRKMLEPTEIYDMLRQAGLRKTPVRIGVLDVLTEVGRPVPVSALLGKLPHHTDAVTVYRTLNTFAKLKLVHRIRGENNEWLYAIGNGGKAKQHHHPHFVCEDCGAVECLSESEVPGDFLPELHIPKRYKVNYFEVVLHGTCGKCK